MFWKRKKVGKYKCPKCGKEHDQIPAIGFNIPHYYNVLSEQDKNEIAELTSDFCIIRHPEQTDRFIRAYLRMQINDSCEDLDYGIWVSVSEQTFCEYNSEFGDNKEGQTYFGRIANEISDYQESTLGIHVNVETRANGSRPELIPHESEHQLVTEWKQGITLKDAENRVSKLFGNDG